MEDDLGLPGNVAERAPGLWSCLANPRILAFVGGGGKTTLTFRAASEAAKAGQMAVVTTTTRMLMPEAPRDVDAVLVAGELEVALQGLRAAFASGALRIALVSGSEDSPHGVRAVGVPPAWVPQLLGGGLGDVAIVEADGSRKLPFKAPQVPREPVLPDAVEAVVAVCGVDCLGSILCEEAVCRADVVANVAGASLGDAVTPEVVGKVMGNRSLWCHAMLEANLRFYVAINKVDEESMPAACAIEAAVRQHGPEYGPAGICALLFTGSGPEGFGTVLRRLTGS